jgi:hypothetical protein
MWGTDWQQDEAGAVDRRFTPAAGYACIHPYVSMGSC